MTRLTKAAPWVLLAGVGAVAAGAVATGEFVAGVVAVGVVAGVDGAVAAGVVAAGVLLVAVVEPPAVLVVVEPLSFVATGVAGVLLSPPPPPPQAPRTAEMARARASLLPDTS